MSSALKVAIPEARHEGMKFRRACAARVTVLGLCLYACVRVCVCVCVCVCVSVTQHLTLYVIIHATNDSNLPSGG